jgi:hypothetical protein
MYIPNEVILYTATQYDIDNGHPSISRAEIDGPTATYILENYNHNNRKIGRNLEVYISAMKKGQWQTNGDSLRFDTNGRLLDGQTRLTAIANTGIPQTFLILRGLPPSVHSTMDSGKARTSANKFEFIHGQDKDSAPIMKAIKCILLYKNNNSIISSGIDKKDASDDDCLQFYVQHRTILNELGDFCNKIRKQSKVLALSDMIFLHFIFSEIDDIASREFITNICTGVAQTTNNSTLIFRHLLKRLGLKSKEKEESHVIVYTIISAWNRDRQNIPPAKYITSILWKSGTNYPVAQ